MRTQYVSALCLALLLIGFGGGCNSTSSGSSALSSDKVNQIQKGVTTKAQVEAMFGPPANVTMVSGGKRIMSYYFSQSNTHTDAQSFIPVAGLFLNKTEGQTNTRTLQVNLDANDVVEDYQYNDNTNNIEATGGIIGSSVKSTPTSNPSSGN
jgi:SmpA / OmlA family